MEKENQLTQEESFRIIQNMIAAAKNDVKADAFIFLLWGWLVLIASVLQFVFAKAGGVLYYWQSAPWLLMPLGGVITVIYSIRQGKKEKTRTAVTETLKYTWIAFTAALMIILFFNSMSITQVLPCIMTLYGIGLFLSGSVLQFKPLIAGGIFCWLCAILGFLFQNEFLLLILAASVLGGYIIPGYLLKMNNRK
jgi:hypothetical protein